MRSRRPLNWVQWISLFTAVAVAVLMPFLVIRIQDAHHDTNVTIRKLLCYFEARTSSPSSGVTAAEKRQAARIYDSALAQINEPPCP